MKIFIATITVIAIAATSYASDSIGLGVRAGSATNYDGYFTEVYGDLYLNRIFSLGAALAYTSVDRGATGVKRDTSVPVTALFKVHAPIPFVQPYAGLGAALVFHNHRNVKGTPVALLGFDLKLGLTPFFLNMEYRRQFDDKLDYLGGGVGFKF